MEIFLMDCGFLPLFNIVFGLCVELFNYIHRKEYYSSIRFATKFQINPFFFDKLCSVHTQYECETHELSVVVVFFILYELLFEEKEKKQKNCYFGLIPF